MIIKPRFLILFFVLNIQTVLAANDEKVDSSHSEPKENHLIKSRINYTQGNEFNKAHQKNMVNAVSKYVSNDSMFTKYKTKVINIAADNISNWIKSPKANLLTKHSSFGKKARLIPKTNFHYKTPKSAFKKKHINSRLIKIDWKLQTSTGSTNIGTTTFVLKRADIQ